MAENKNEMQKKIRIVMNGAAGKMGRALSSGLSGLANMQIVGAVDVKTTDVDYGFLCGVNELGFGIKKDLAAVIDEVHPNVVIDFTSPAVVMQNIQTAVSHKTPIVVGTTGFSEADFRQIEGWCAEYQTPVFIASNFALGAVLMMRFAREAARYMPHIEVIERHHDQKLDAPSGTAVTTMEMIAEVRRPVEQGNANEFERLPGSRGGELDGMRVHSVRLPGYVATQEVVFGATGQVLCIRHDALSREAYIPGVAMAVEHIVGVSEGVLLRDLDTLL